MKINFRHFPHPVLASFTNDYTRGNFQAYVKVSNSDGKYNIEAEFKIKCSDIEKLISSGKAKYGIHVECPLTCFRRFKSSLDPNISATYSAQKLDGKVEGVTFVYADQAIKNYSSDLFNPVFEEYSFSFTSGDILAVGEQFSFQAEKDLDPIGETPSIFTVQPNQETDNPPPLKYSLTEKINIFLNEKNFNKYNYLQGNQGFHHIFACTLAVPVLTAILQDIKNSRERMEESYNNRKWYRVLIRRLKDFGIDLENGDEIYGDPISLAQKIIGNPLEQSFEDLEELIQL